MPTRWESLTFSSRFSSLSNVRPAARWLGRNRNNSSHCTLRGTAEQLQVHVKICVWSCFKNNIKVLRWGGTSCLITKLFLFCCDWDVECVVTGSTSTLRSAVFSVWAAHPFSFDTSRGFCYARWFNSEKTIVTLLSQLWHSERLSFSKWGGGSAERAAAQRYADVNGSWIRTWWRPDSGGWGSEEVGPGEAHGGSVNLRLFHFTSRNRKGKITVLCIFSPSSQCWGPR